MQEGLYFLGYVAGAFTTGSTIPQVIKTIRTKDAQDVSLRMYLLYLSGAALWVLYGVLRQDGAIIVANGIAVILTSIMLFLKTKYGNKTKSKVLIKTK